MYDKVMTLKL